MGLSVPLHAAFGLAIAVAASRPVALQDGRVKIIEPAAVAPGAWGEVSVTILDRPLRGTPIELSLESGEVVLPDNRLDWDDVVDPQAEQPRLLARVVAPGLPGEYRVRGRVEYVTCRAERCRPRTAFVEWRLVVRVAAPAGP